jgi:tetratricopeptide (TPR) repeat protein
MTFVKWIRQRMGAGQTRPAARVSHSPKCQGTEDRPPDPHRPGFEHRRHQPIFRRSMLPLVFLTLCLTKTAEAANAENVFNEANRAFAQQRFSDAVRGYEALIAQNGYSAPVLFDLANAYSREGKWGLAILNYERAQLMAPRDPDIAANLKFALEKAGLTGAPTPWYAKSAQVLSPNAWAWIGSFSLLAACSALFARHLYPARRVAFRWITVIGAITLFAAISAALFWWQVGRGAVVVDKSVPLRVAPAIGAESSGSLPEGDSVTIQDTHGDFALVQDSTGRRGWLSQAQIAQVIAKHHNSGGVL